MKMYVGVKKRHDVAGVENAGLELHGKPYILAVLALSKLCEILLLFQCAWL